ncbi:MAG: helix-turn-helix transcriptional regulator [Spirochaetales bacterium]|nr:helix-turn-helix transcriptional regulator [Spirochaetales bacterium]
MIRCAEDLFISKGLAGTSMPDIAGRADLNVRTLYRYY